MTDINEIIGRAIADLGDLPREQGDWQPDDFSAIGAAVVKALGEAGYVIEGKAYIDATIAELTRKRGWRDIETAPKDGSRVLCWREGWEPTFLNWKTNRRIADSRERHMPEQNEFYATHSDSYFGDPDEMDDYDLALIGKGPTHWLPVTEP